MSRNNRYEFIRTKNELELQMSTTSKSKYDSCKVSQLFHIPNQETEEVCVIYCNSPGPPVKLAGEAPRENEMDQVIEFVGNNALLAGGFGAVLVLLVYTEVMRMARGSQSIS